MYYLYILRGPRNHLLKGDGAKFTKRNKTDIVEHIEEFSTYREARQREAQIKGWRREKKENLIKFGKPVI